MGYLPRAVALAFLRAAFGEATALESAPLPSIAAESLWFELSEQGKPTANALKGRPVSPVAAKRDARIETDPAINLSLSHAGGICWGTNVRFR